LSGGQLDTIFGSGGRVNTSFGSTNVAFIAAMAIQNDGKIVVAGQTGDAAGNIAVNYWARYLAQDTERCEKSRGLRLGFFWSALVHAISPQATDRAGWRTPAELKLRLALLVTAEIQRET
jgi:hypothetical protein